MKLFIFKSYYTIKDVFTKGDSFKIYWVISDIEYEKLPPNHTQHNELHADLLTIWSQHCEDLHLFKTNEIGTLWKYWITVNDSIGRQSFDKVFYPEDAKKIGSYNELGLQQNLESLFL